MWVQDLRWDVGNADSGHAPDCFRVYFVLPKGGYATTVLGAVFALRQDGVEEGQTEEN